MKRFVFLNASKRCTSKQTQSALLRGRYNHNHSHHHRHRHRHSHSHSHQRWLACGVLLLSVHHAHSRWRGRHQVSADAAVPSLPRPLPLPKGETKLLESKIWKCLKNLLQLSKDILRIMKRAFYLGLCFLPPVASSPLLLLGSPDVTQRWWEVVRQSIWAAGGCRDGQLVVGISL